MRAREQLDDRLRTEQWACRQKAEELEEVSHERSAALQRCAELEEALRAAHRDGKHTAQQLQDAGRKRLDASAETAQLQQRLVSAEERYKQLEARHLEAAAQLMAQQARRAWTSSASHTIAPSDCCMRVNLAGRAHGLVEGRAARGAAPPRQGAGSGPAAGPAGGGHGAAGGVPGRVRSHCRFVLPLILFIPDSLRDLIALFPKRRCDRTLQGSLEKLNLVNSALRAQVRCIRRHRRHFSYGRVVPIASSTSGFRAHGRDAARRTWSSSRRRGPCKCARGLILHQSSLAPGASSVITAQSPVVTSDLLAFPIN
jgi:hypothetical protein